MKTLLILVALSAIQFSEVSTQNVYYNYFDFINKTIADYGFKPINPSLVSFRLWTRNQTMQYVPLTFGQLANVTYFRRNKPFKIVTHGYLNCADHPWMTRMKSAYLQKDDCNIIQLNWAKGSILPYPTSAGYSKDLGDYIAKLMKELNETMGVPYYNMHCIGHSLGAHICGFAGKYINSINYTISRITGLDPAGPLFTKASQDQRLNRTDAAFVDVIHTDIRKYGLAMPLGTIDFYPNGGEAPQPGCFTVDKVKDIVFGCSHHRSYRLFIESINSTGFNATNCNNTISYYLRACGSGALTATMGDGVQLSQTGTFYLTTNAYQPYARNGVI